MGCDAIFLKQTLQNKYWVTQIALYPCMRLATLQVCWIEKKKKKCALGQQFSKILKGSAKQEVSECCNHSSWLRLTRKQVREVLCSAALPPTPSPHPHPVDTAGREAEAKCRDRHTLVFALWTAGPDTEVEHFLTRSFLLKRWCNITENFEKKLIMSPFITPTEVFSFIVYAVGQNKGSIPPMEHYGVTNWTQ